MAGQKPEIILTPTDFVAIANQSLEFTFGLATIQGELANFRISKNQWVYFDIKDDLAKVACFASVYALPGPLEDGMLVVVSGQPRLHPQFGFSVNIQTIRPCGEGAIKKAFELLKAKLQAEGLFEINRKRPLVYPPQKIALVTSVESAAYVDFVKVLNNRWPFVDLKVYDVLVQGVSAPQQLVKAINDINNQANLVDVLVVTRGGGSNDDLSAFNDERVVRVIAASRVHTLVAIGHEVDISLSELAADKRASTPSNAAEVLVPDKHAETDAIGQVKQRFKNSILSVVNFEQTHLKATKQQLGYYLNAVYQVAIDSIMASKSLLLAYNPNLALKRGYSITRIERQIIKSVQQVKIGDEIDLTLSDGCLNAKVQDICKTK